MTVHNVKCWPPFAAQVARREKTFEIRRDDRGYAVGDMLRLDEWDPAIGQYTGRHVATRITGLWRSDDFPGGPIRPGFVVLSIELYRTWIAGQLGPGDWSKDTP